MATPTILQPFQLSAATGCNITTATAWAEIIGQTMHAYRIDTGLRRSSYLAQIAHESQCFTRLEESLAYRPGRLLEVFPKYFDEVSAVTYAGNAKAIASRVYANRMGNGDEASGDGWKYRGRGLIQLTGRDNYRACGAALGMELEKFPDRLTDRTVAALSSAWFWSANGLNELADAQRFEQICRRVSGGTQGLVERRKLYERCLKVFPK